MGLRSRFVVAITAVAILAIVIVYARFFTPGATSAVSVATALPSPAASPSAPPTPAPSATPLPSPAASVPATASAQATATPTPATPAPTPTPTPNPNLLSYVNGAFVRRWTIGAGSGGNALAMEHLYWIDPKFTKPVAFEFEMPSTSHITRIGATLNTTIPVTVHVATGTSVDALHDAGTIAIASGDGNTEHAMDVNVDARYVQLTFERHPGTEVRIYKVAAYGVPGPPEQGSFAGTWVGPDNADADGDVMFSGVKGLVPYAVPPTDKWNPHRTLVVNGTFTDFWCDRIAPAWHGTVSGNFVTGPPNSAHLQLAGDGKLLIGAAQGIYSGDGIIFMRDTRRGGLCEPTDIGNGPTVLALMRDASREEYEIEPSYIPGYHFHRVIPMLLDQSMLDHAQFAMLIGDCTATNDLLPYQQQLLLNWVAAGHKLIIRDSDMCSSSEYSFIPYKFTTVATGARGARGYFLSIADPSTLGSGPSDPAHFLDTVAYVNSKSQNLGDADIMQTDDPHWCGHLFARNVAGASGWAHAYARVGRGLIIYDGFDRDDIGAHDAPALAVLRYEYAQPVQGSLPCNVQVASALALYPAADRQLPAGTPATLRVPLSLTYVAKSALNQRVALAISGDALYRMHVSPPAATIRSGQTIPVTATISLPKGWSGVHAFTVTANGGFNAKAQTSITIDGSVALAKAFQSQRRVRIYGIHFDVASATVLPQSEATISQIAQVLRANPSWRMRVEGYTDSDGGAAYNLDLSNRRARAVVSDLVVHYKIAASRLVAVGFGLTSPVAPNTTAGDKALNRRVELVRL